MTVVVNKAVGCLFDVKVLFPCSGTPRRVDVRLGVVLLTSPDLMSDFVPLKIGRSVIEGAPYKLVLAVQLVAVPVVVIASTVMSTTVRAKK